MTHTREITEDEMKRFNKFFSDAETKPNCIIVIGGDEFWPKQEYFGQANGDEISNANYLRRYDNGSFAARNERFGCQDSNRIELINLNRYHFEREDQLGYATHSHAQFEYKV